MPIVVKVVTDAEYTAWAAEKKVQMAALADDPSKTYTMDELKQRGEKVYAANCAACHQPNGKGAGAFPALDGSKVVNFPIGAMIVVIPIVKDLENLHMIYAPKILADVGLHEFSSDLIKFINE
jgi:cytochrome c